MKKVIVGGVLLTLALIGVATGSANKGNLTDAQRVAITSHCNETPKPWDC